MKVPQWINSLWSFRWNPKGRISVLLSSIYHKPKIDAQIKQKERGPILKLMVLTTLHSFSILPTCKRRPGLKASLNMNKPLKHMPTQQTSSRWIQLLANEPKDPVPAEPVVLVFSWGNRSWTNHFRFLGILSMSTRSNLMKKLVPRPRKRGFLHIMNKEMCECQTSLYS